MPSDGSVRCSTGIVTSAPPMPSKPASRARQHAPDEQQQHRRGERVDGRQRRTRPLAASPASSRATAEGQQPRGSAGPAVRRRRAVPAPLLAVRWRRRSTMPTATPTTAPRCGAGKPVSSDCMPVSLGRKSPTWRPSLAGRKSA
jgi:hypothetical protein